MWHCSLTGEDRLKLERVQKSALHIILGQRYDSYRAAMKQTGSKTLFERRRKICLKFAQKSLKNEKFCKWFKENKSETSTRQEQMKFHEVYCRTDRYKKSPISYLTSLLNIEHWTSTVISEAIHLHCLQVNYWDIRGQDGHTLQWCLLVLTSLYHITWQIKPSLLLLSL